VQISSRVRHARGLSVTAAPASHSSARGVANRGSTNRRPTGSRCARMRRGRTAAALQTRRERAETTVRRAYREHFDCRVNASRRSQLTARNRAATVYHAAASNVDCIRAGRSRDPVTWCGHVVRVSTGGVCVCVSVDNCLPVRGVVASGGVN